MAKGFKTVLSFLVISSFMWKTGKAEGTGKAEDCKPMPVELDIIVDWTKNVDAREREITNQIVVKILSSLSDHSSANFNALKGDIVTHIAEVNTPYASMSWSSKLYDYALEQSADYISLSAVDDELKTRFSVNAFRQTAELAIIFVSDSTKVVGSSKMLDKKKAIFVVSGDSVPRVYFPLASNEHHVHLVNEDGNNLTNLIHLVLNQVSCASKYVCDKDKYRTKRGYKCLKCQIPCGEDLVGGSDTCSKYCPFRPLKKENNTDPATVNGNSSEVEEVLDDNKSMFLMYVAGAIIVTLVIMGIAIYCIRKARRKNVMTPGNSEETMRKSPVNDVNIPIGTQEVGEGEIGAMPEERGSLDSGLGTEIDQSTPFLPQTGEVRDQSMPLLPGPDGVAGAHDVLPLLPTDNINTREGSPDVHSGSDNGSVTEFSLTFSKLQELDANGLTFMDPAFQSIR